MKAFFFGFTGSMVFGVSVIAPLIAKQLHEATVRQCTLKAWDADYAYAHEEFCARYLTETERSRVASLK